MYLTENYLNKSGSSIIDAFCININIAPLASKIYVLPVARFGFGPIYTLYPPQD